MKSGTRKKKKKKRTSRKGGQTGEQSGLTPCRYGAAVNLRSDFVNVSGRQRGQRSGRQGASRRLQPSPRRKMGVKRVNRGNANSA